MLPITIKNQVLKYKDENGNYTSIDAVSGEDVSNLVTNWMAENITEDPTVVIDSSLTISGAAADAKKTGDEISDLKNAKANTSNPVFTGSISIGRKEDTATGNNSVAIGNNNEASGNYSLAFGSNNIAKGNESVAVGGSNNVEADFGVAFGNRNTISGAGISGGFAAGSNNIVRGGHAAAFGSNNTASGASSFASGNVSQATGVYSAAFGRSKADLPYMFSCGLYNANGEVFPEWVAGTQYKVGDVVLGTGADRMSYVCKVANADTTFNYLKWDAIEFRGKQIFVVGMGGGKNAFEVQFDGKAVIAGDVEIGKSISRGRKDGTDVGTGSIAFGQNVEASGTYSTALGSSSVASGLGAFATGLGNKATGNYSTAFGTGNTVSAQNAFAVGRNNHVIQSGAAIGNGNVVSGGGALASGQYCTASGMSSAAFGMTTANLSNMFSCGIGNVSGEPFPIWISETQYAVGDVVLENKDAQYAYKCKIANADTVKPSMSTKWESIYATGKQLFVVGNGDKQANAFEVQYNGTAKAQTALQIGNTKITEAQLQQLLALLN